MSNEVDRASETAQQALVTATTALTLIKQHEEVCGRRWSLVARLLTLVLTSMLSVLGLLVTDKLGWFTG